jgi:hypothetical protein
MYHANIPNQPHLGDLPMLLADQITSEIVALWVSVTIA